MYHVSIVLAFGGLYRSGVLKKCILLLADSLTLGFCRHLSGDEFERLRFLFEIWNIAIAELWSKI